jgi:type II secretory pathway pseudopilin PulG
MNTGPRSTLSVGAFTLLELLTVIGIIAILMGLLFPVLAIVRNGARVAQAKNDIKQIEAAVKAYYADYGKYPPLTVAGASDAAPGQRDQLVGDPAANAKEINSKLFNTLRAIAEDPNLEHKLNPRRVVFLETRGVSDPEQPRGGFLDRTGGKNTGNRGCYFDPWGNQYNVVIDTNADNQLDLDQCYTDFGGAEKPRDTVGVFSLGKDNKLGDKGDRRLGVGRNASDDITSWQ